MELLQGFAVGGADTASQNEDSYYLYLRMVTLGLAKRIDANFLISLDGISVFESHDVTVWLYSCGVLVEQPLLYDVVVELNYAIVTESRS